VTDDCQAGLVRVLFKSTEMRTRTLPGPRNLPPRDQPPTNTMALEIVIRELAVFDNLDIGMSHWCNSVPELPNRVEVLTPMVSKGKGDLTPWYTCNSEFR
jgi:hypothetical protein